MSKTAFVHYPRYPDCTVGTPMTEKIDSIKAVGIGRRRIRDTVRVPDSWVGFELLGIMIAETWMTVMYKQIEDSEAVDTAQITINRRMGKVVRNLDVDLIWICAEASKEMSKWILQFDPQLLNR